jgi:hypothetical protein
VCLTSLSYPLQASCSGTPAFASSSDNLCNRSPRKDQLDTYIA